jgi:hypothetical protein
MYRLTSKLNVRILAAMAFGFLMASTFTHLQGPCTTTIPSEDGSHCVEFSKAVMHPKDLINNKQDTLTKFVGTLAIGSLAGFALLSAYGQLRTRKKV